MAQKKKAKPAKSNSTGKTAKKRSSAKSNDPKYVYDFGKKTDGDAKQRELLGGNLPILMIEFVFRKDQ